MTNLRVGVLRGGCLLLSSFGLLLTSTGCSQEPVPADPAISLAEPLIRLLATGDPPGRVHAVTELGKLKHRAVVQPVLQVALNDHQPQVRIAAIDALGQPDLLNEKELKSVVYMLSAADPEVRMAACRALGGIRSPATADALVQCMYDREPSVRLAAADAMALMGQSGVPKLAGIFAKGSGEQKAMVAGVLAKARDPAYADLLVPALKDLEDGVRRATAEALGAMGATSAVPALVELIRAPLSPQTVEEFSARLRQRPSEFDFEIMVKLLDEDCDRKKIRRDQNKYPWLRDGRAHAPWFALVMAQRQRDAANLVRGVALDAILKIAPPNLDTVLMDLLADADEDIGAQASRVYRDRGESARTVLIAAVRDRKTPSFARSRAVDILAPLPPAPAKEGAEKLRLMLNKTDDDLSEESSADEPTPAAPAVRLSQDALALFMELQNDPDPRLRATIAFQLGRAGVKEAIPPLLDAFRGADPAIVERVVAALGSFKDDRVAPVLLPALDDPRYTSNRVSIVRTLGLLGDKRATPALLKAAMNSQDLGVRSLAIEALAGVGDPSAVAPMVEWFGKLLSTRAELASMTPPTDAAQLQQHRGRMSQNDQLIQKVIHYFGVVRAKDAVPALTPLLSAASGNYGGFATSAMVALGRIGDPRAVAPISELIRKGGTYHARLYVNHVTKAGIDALTKIGDPAAIPVLKAFAKNWQDPKDPFTGKYAIEAMGRLKHPDAVAVLMDYLTDPAIDPVMKDACVGRALAIAGLAAKESLLKQVKDAPKPAERALSDPGMYAAQILAVLPNPDINVVPDMMRLIETKPPTYIVQRAVECLAQTHHESAVVALANLVKTADTPTRQLAALGLGKVKLRSAVPALEAALKDPDAKVRECAALSLSEYGVAAAVDKKE